MASTENTELTDTGKTRAIAEEAGAASGEAAAERMLDRMRSGPGSGESSEHIRSLARDEAEMCLERHQNKCVSQGPMYELRKAIRTIEGALINMDKEFTEHKSMSEGVLQTQARYNKMLMTVLTIVSTVGMLVTILLKWKHG